MELIMGIGRIPDGKLLAVSCQLSAFRRELLSFFFDFDEAFVGSFDGAKEFIELVVHRFVISVLGVLNQDNQ